ncbi:trehalose-6-phosphate hydrolase TreA [Clostridioides difficile]|uniref:alpha,alpha-phosphotrehalase n=1 Tax=Clostridioides difficile TaxID=1496 RepID=UPI0010268C57|nr:alpha,alpha-phosphotrehalase [Clostridioides difficile]VFE33595.1 trehalose-6-phosphate hydrolase TreA [Clostridioides difficile]VIH67282.1 trehalose-6-phosphate hydrolase TreA [Clostridioides difficile]HBG8209559.1 alpha,alpha-phosphotrehalase [Clostridioides difficile]HBG8237505.1 alpha,alpha-phosphotrehalase [Clostridioides difficile]HBH2066438.1 alpha,alpha-phosphotrehalase [Clostridioides difficile]
MLDFKKSIVYQIYLKSFNDTTNNGLGDLNGITEKLDYLEFLGVDYVWITPFFVSPQNDNGYDVADYYNIDPIYGTMDDLENLIKEAKKRNIGIMLDMVFNHTSIENEWFKKALKGDEYYKDFYIFKNPKEDKSAPTNWESKFGGNAWEFVEEFNQYYLHLFDKTQADLNWENPNVRKELKNILKFWIDKGIKGFRFDVVNLISKPEKYEDDLQDDGRRFYTDGKKVHQYLKEMCEESGILENDMLTVGEMSSTTIENCVKYSNPDEKELSMCFNFHHLKVDYKNQNKWMLQDCDFIKLKKILNEWQIGMQKGNGWNALFWCNHDQPRIISRFGDDKKYYKESAKMLATMIYLLRGTPCIYQGEEIGMTNACFTNIKQYVDVESLNYFDILKSKGMKDGEIYNILQERSRDNSRTPMQWNNSKNAGFSESKSWIEVINNYRNINVENSLKDKDSIFYYYKKLIALRKKYDVVAYGDFRPLLEEHDSIFAYKRCYEKESLVVLNNFYDKEIDVVLENEELEKYKCIISNYGDRKIVSTITLRPYECIALFKNEK